MHVSNICFEGNVSQILVLGLKPIFHWNLPLRRLIFRVANAENDAQTT